MMQGHIDGEGTSATNKVKLESRIIPRTQHTEWQNQRMENNEDFDLDQAPLMAYQVNIMKLQNTRK